MQPKVTELTVSNRTVVRVILLIAATIIAFRFVAKVGYILELIFIAGFLAVALNPVVSWFARNLKLRSRIAATAISYVTVVAILGTIIALVIPPLVRQTIDFIADAPDTISQALNDENSTFGQYVDRYNLSGQVEGFTEDIQERTEDLRSPVVTTAGRVGSALVSIITVLVLTFMMLVEGPMWKKRFWELTPKQNRTHYKSLAERMYRAVTGYVNGQVVLAFMSAGFALITLLIASTLLDVSVNAVGLAGILVITGLIPMIGNTIGGTILVLACLFVSVPLALIMAIYFIVYQQIENVTLQPYIQSKYNELSALLVFMAALIGIGFGGILGALIAIPFASCVKILLLDYLDRRNNVKTA